MSQASKIALILEVIQSAESNLRSAKQMLNEIAGKSSQDIYTKIASELPPAENLGEPSVVEGVFNGQTMINNEGKEYPVPANYASKSKLVPGDVLKLTIKEDGSFLYKQIGPVERKRVIGTLTYEDGQYKVIAGGQAYKVLLASVTYFKGEVGDKVTLVVTEMEESEWGSIENVIPKSEMDLEDIEI